MRTLIFFLPYFFLVSATLAQEMKYTEFQYENGVVSSQGFMKNGKPEGYWKTFYPNGKLKSEGNRVNHELDSLWVFYSEDGITTQSITYSEGKKDGEKKSFYPDGIIQKKEVFASDVLTDTVVRFHPSGNVSSMVPIDTLGKGKEQGIGYEYADEDGRVTAVVQYRNGFIAGRERVNRKDKFNQKQGLWRYFYPTMVTKEEGRFKNDKKNGYWKTFDEEGNLLETLKYVDGILIPDPEELAKLDIKREYHSNAQVKSVGSYNKGIKEGVHREYSMEGEVTGAKIYSKGKVIGEGIVDAEGRRQGPWKEYYDTGELRSEGNYKKGLRDGDWVFYYRDGKEEQRGGYYKGKPEGDWKWTYNNGQTWREESFIEGYEEGLAIEYNDTGKVVSKGNYLSGEREGEWIIDLGDHREEGKYVAGQKQGMWKAYFPSGKVKFEGKYEQGRESGTHTEYYESGQVREVGLFKFGSKEGDWYTYNEEGIQTSIITYKQDKPIRIDGEKVVEAEENNDD